MIEKLFELIAPDECLACGAEGSCLCTSCAKVHLSLKKPACVMCNALNNNNRVCVCCRTKTNVYGASIAYRYEGITKELVGKMKYEGRRSIARYFAGKLPKADMGKDTIVCYVPCDGPARRARGFDQAELIAKHYAKLNHLQFRNLLIRIEHKKQVGQKRQERFKNVEGNFVSRSNIGDSSVMLIDDVVTTGATISECAKTLRSAGAKKVWVVAIAKK